MSDDDQPANDQTPNDEGHGQSNGDQQSFGGSRGSDQIDLSKFVRHPAAFTSWISHTYDSTGNLLKIEEGPKCQPPPEPDPGA